MPDSTINYVYWLLLIIFGVLGMWHAIAPAREGQEWRNGLAALTLYLMLGAIGLRYFLVVAALLFLAAPSPLAATGINPDAGERSHRQI